MKAIRLFQLYLDNNMTPEEYREFWRLLNAGAEEDTLSDELKDLWHSTVKTQITLPDEEWRSKMRHLMGQLEQEGSDGAGQKEDTPKKVRRRILITSRVAAAIILLSLGTYWLLNHSAKMPSGKIAEQVRMVPADVPPGGNKAMLTLGNGSRIVLDSAGNGLLASQGGNQVIKTANGQLLYKAIPGSAPEPEYNTLTTPRGGEYNLILPDGSRVWLNAGSAIRYPAAFTGKERLVEITGEAYFEVARNNKNPFRVKTGETEVVVLGTGFDVMAYEDETSLTTTLVEGAVKVTKGGKSRLLQPGQQAQINRDGTMKVLENVDVDQAVAWKNGITSFRDADIKSIMRQVARWYDVDVEFKGNIPERIFTGDISRNANVSELLKVLELSNIHFSIHGRTITVLP